MFRWVGYVAGRGEKYILRFNEKTRRKEKLGSPGSRRKFYIKTDQNADWIHQAQDRDHWRTLMK